ncbi:MAG: inositol monophosphatase [Hyphomicrobiales bacterium]|nr:inositol monophosphatase [Hyphomicrobiales bacterium]
MPNTPDRPDLPDRDAVDRIIRDVAAAEILPRFRNLRDHQIREKNPGDLVTDADEAAERALEAALTALLPGSAVIGEEMAEKRSHLLAVIGEDRPVWVLDPVDGTHNFAHGEGRFAVIVTLVRARRTLAGWIHAPLTGVTSWAAVGQGSWHLPADGPAEPVRLGPAPPIAGMTGSLGRKLRERLRRDGAVVPEHLLRYRCTGQEYMDLAAGAIHFAQYTGLKPWDHAAGVLIHAEAGGYGALTGDGTGPGIPYHPDTEINRGTLLMAPDPATWAELRDLIRSVM